MGPFSAICAQPDRTQPASNLTLEDAVLCGEILLIEVTAPDRPFH
jgi:hypothetical protein